MGTIVSDLGGLDKFVWITSAYVVTGMAGMPSFRKAVMAKKEFDASQANVRFTYI
jgi:hypothetical protein